MPFPVNVNYIFSENVFDNEKPVPGHHQGWYNGIMSAVQRETT